MWIIASHVVKSCVALCAGKLDVKASIAQRIQAALQVRGEQANETVFSDFPSEIIDRSSCPQNKLSLKCKNTNVCEICCIFDEW